MARSTLTIRITTLFLAGGLNVVLIALVVVLALAKGGPALGEGSVSGRVREILWFALLCAIGAFATIEILKRVLALRGYYQRIETRRWLADRSDGGRPFDELLSAMGLSDAKSRDRRGGVARVLELSEEHRVFNLPTEQLTAQISSAADVALAAEGRVYVGFLAGVTGLTPDVVLAAFRTGTGKELSPAEHEIAGQGAFGVSRRVRAGIDQLQISLAERWRRFLQSAALSIAGGYGLAFAPERVVQGGPPGPSESLFILAALVVGGALAWVFRDLTAVLERTRR